MQILRTEQEPPSGVVSLRLSELLCAAGVVGKPRQALGGGAFGGNRTIHRCASEGFDQSGRAAARGGRGLERSALATSASASATREGAAGRVDFAQAGAATRPEPVLMVGWPAGGQWWHSSKRTPLRAGVRAPDVGEVALSADELRFARWHGLVGVQA